MGVHTQERQLGAVGDDVSALGGDVQGARERIRKCADGGENGGSDAGGGENGGGGGEGAECVQGRVRGAGNVLAPG